MHLNEINEVIKASPAIQIQGKMTHLQRRAWNVLLANAYDELPNREIHRVSVAELARKLGYASHDSEHLKETLKALVDYTVEWNILGKDKKQRWGAAALLASTEIENGICAYSFAAHLRYKLYNPRIYTKLNYVCKTSSRADTPWFCGKSVLIISTSPGIKAKRRLSP